MKSGLWSPFRLRVLRRQNSQAAGPSFLGYVINVLAVPALARGIGRSLLALIVGERTGRAIRRAAVQAMISHAGESIGRGWVFGLNETLIRQLQPLARSLSGIGRVVRKA